MKQMIKVFGIWLGAFIIGTAILGGSLLWAQAAWGNRVGDLPDGVMAIIGLGSLFYVFMGAVFVLLIGWLVVLNIQLGVRVLSRIRSTQQ